MTLHLGKGLDLPESFATEGVVAIGMRGSGKSNTLVRWAEVLYDAGIPFVAVDPKGDWGGIKSSADGKRPGLAVPIFGGLPAHQDFPLTEQLGARIADLLVDENLSAVLDVSVLSIAARARFLTEFCNQLMRRHQQEPHVRCVILEEAHRYIPQQIPRGSGQMAACKEAAAAVLLEGRAFGLGCWAATQRPARLHKDVLEEVGTAILHRIGAAATNDLRTIAGWVKHEDLGDEIVPSLARLADGEAWVLAPATLGVAQRVKIDRRRTFDSAATPLVGAGSRPTLTMADIDTAAIKEALHDTIERAKADDPKELRKRIADLVRQLDAQQPREIEVRVEVPTVSAEGLALAEDMREHMLAGTRMAEALIAAVTATEQERREVKAAVRAPRDPGRPERRKTPSPVAPRAPVAEPGSVGKGELAVLAALAQHPEGCTREALTVITGYKRSTRNTYLQRVAAAGNAENRGDRWFATEAGALLVADVEPLPTGSALLEHYLATLPAGEAATLGAIAEADRDRGLTREEIQEETGYKRSTSNTYIQRLSTRELVLVTGGAVLAADLLFD